MRWNSCRTAWFAAAPGPSIDAPSSVVDGRQGLAQLGQRGALLAQRLDAFAQAEHALVDGGQLGAKLETLLEALRYWPAAPRVRRWMIAWWLTS